MDESNKGRSPFYPGQPVPVELFTGRQDAVERILRRGAGQVAQGKPMAFFVQGEYGIGKSSHAGYLLTVVEKVCSLHGINVPPERRSRSSGGFRGHPSGDRPLWRIRPQDLGKNWILDVEIHRKATAFWFQLRS